MPEKPIPAPADDEGRLSSAEEDAQVEHAILGLLLVSPQAPGLWSAEEVAQRSATRSRRPTRSRDWIARG